MSSNNKTLINDASCHHLLNPLRYMEGRAVFSAIGLVKWKKQNAWIINSILSGLSFRKRLGTVHTLPEQTAFVVGLI